MVWNKVSNWLRVPQITDPVDRRNAATVQMVLLGLGTLPPLLWAYRVLGTDMPWRPGETVSMVSGLLVSAMALVCLLMLRRGRFQRAVRLLLVVVAVTLLLAYGGSGIGNQGHVMPLQVMWLFVAGMMVNRRALWAMFAVLVMALFLGAVADAEISGDTLVQGIGDAVVRTAIFLLVAVIVDRSVAALRQSLEEAVARGAELERANALLREEMSRRESAQAQLLHAQKMEAVGRMASGLTHDFGHLLTLVGGYATQAVQANSPEARAAALDGVRSAAARANAQVRKLLHFARSDASTVESFDALEALNEIAPMLRQTLGAAVRLELDLPAAPAPIHIDREQFALVLLNLAANAADAMPDGGRFRLHARVDDDASTLEIQLHDDGDGIADALRQRIFEPFFTTKPEAQGTGLGLPMSRELLAAAGGTLALLPADAERNGTTFRIRLPLQRQSMDTPTSRAGSPPP